mmetsp:Transcript_26070/g.35560  ORF Transcript_26070/g.35560 Transcript_26070/m.35560 type:complete len:291 (-) Transcript_26070:3215-4087(-)
MDVTVATSSSEAHRPANASPRPPRLRRSRRPRRRPRRRRLLLLRRPRRPTSLLRRRLHRSRTPRRHRQAPLRLAPSVACGCGAARPRPALATSTRSVPCTRPTSSRCGIRLFQSRRTSLPTCRASRPFPTSITSSPPSFGRTSSSRMACGATRSTMRSFRRTVPSSFTPTRTSTCFLPTTSSTRAPIGRPSRRRPRTRSRCGTWSRSSPFATIRTYSTPSTLSTSRGTNRLARSSSSLPPRARWLPMTTRSRNLLHRASSTTPLARTPTSITLALASLSGTGSRAAPRAL